MAASSDSARRRASAANCWLSYSSLLSTASCSNVPSKGMLYLTDTAPKS
jgi:hypothetical protein